MTAVERRQWKGAMIDLVHDGVSPNSLRAGGDKAVWNALVATAMSAMQRGIPEPDWIAELNRAESNLGRQARMKKTRHERTQRDHHRQLHNAWTAAADRVKAKPRYDAADVAATITAVETFTADAAAPLNDAERAVLHCACTLARRNHTTRPALPRREMQAATGLPEWTVRTTLAHLADSGLLRLAVQGRSATDPRHWRASLYSLPPPDALPSLYQCPKDGPKGELTRPKGDPNPTLLGEHPDLRETYRREAPTMTEGMTMTATRTITVSAIDAEHLAEALDVLDREQGVKVAACDRPAPARHLHAVKSTDRKDTAS